MIFCDRADRELAVRVTEATGRVIWEAPKASESGQPFAFGMWPYGASGLDWLGDIDGDGKVELISRGAISDVRPPTYRRAFEEGR